jgi:hypothetical protein
MELDTAIILIAGGAANEDDVTAEEAKRLGRELGDVSVTCADVLPDGPDLGGIWTSVIELHGPLEALPAALAGLAGRFGSAVDPAASAVSVGRDRIIFERPIPAEVRPVKLYYALFRPPGMAKEQFSALWHDEHAEYVRESDYQLTYHQLHGDDDATARAADAAGFGVVGVDGVAHEEFADRDTFVAATQDEELAEEVAHVANFSLPELNRGILTRVRF